MSRTLPAAELPFLAIKSFSDKSVFPVDSQNVSAGNALTSVNIGVQHGLAPDAWLASTLPVESSYRAV
jgi:hypothetical protein